MRKNRPVLVWAIAIVWLALLAGAAQANTIVVTTTEDPAGAGSCPGTPCSLRQAVASASSGDVIQLEGSSDSPLVYSLKQGSPIVINQSLTIAGDGVDASTIDGSSNIDGNDVLERILKVIGGTVTIEGVKFTGGVDGADENFGSCSPCETLSANGGGALLNAGASVVLHAVTFEGNGVTSGQPVGGAIGNSGTLDMTDVSFIENGAAIGGALFSRGGTITAEDVTFENNGRFDFDGGSVFLYAGGTATLTNTTVVGGGWASSFGGGIENRGSTMTLINDTLSGNLRGSLETDEGASTSVENTILGSGFSDNADFDCVGAGKGNNVDAITAKAITHDLGNNIDQDGACELDATGDQTLVDPKLAPIADNGGPPTEALLHGSAALEAGNEQACPATDARGIARPQGTVCDVGAFEAVLKGEPSATTAAAEAPTSSTGVLGASIDLAGEAGGFHFLWGLSPSRLTAETPEVGAGVLANTTPESEELSGLGQETTYYYRAVADNASGSATAGNVLSFTTLAGTPEPPTVSEVSVVSVAQTSATIEFAINPDGVATSYTIEYGPESSYGQHTEPVDIGATGGERPLTHTITGLEPGHTYHFNVLAINAQAPEGVGGGDRELTTEEQEQPTGGGGNSVTPPVLTPPGVLTSKPPTETLKALPPVPLPLPVLGKSVNVELVSGKVLIALPVAGHASGAGPRADATESLSKGLKFIPLSEARQIPVGSILDTTAGVARIATATATLGKVQTGNFGAGLFKLLQQRSQRGLTELDLMNVHPARQTCATLGKRAVAAKHLSSKVLGRLSANAHGKFTTRGQYSAATVRGTVWSVANQCDGTLTKVTRGVVAVRDFRLRKTVTLFTGQSYLAKAPHS